MTLASGKDLLAASQYDRRQERAEEAEITFITTHSHENSLILARMA
jgi:hypothetical protein